MRVKRETERRRHGTWEVGKEGRGGLEAWNKGGRKERREGWRQRKGKGGNK